ncbi:ferrous iron transport protein B [Mesonia hippocampi]|uniref:Ferrous iron transport protein B n=2 Tax=Mesonia hippocampi TaxID=1628250 RepID=A0A840EMK9_9FLAO|nr:ferrous iron transport protein B [Mesonia hippocampi]MBB4118345.1 ferrous iron transport protein B [Mesonia hippocampi]
MQEINVALVGNPNTGKTSVFNQLTGLNQQVGNYPGITVDKKTGGCQLSKNQSAKIIDLPGTYSLNASSEDERIVTKLLLDENQTDFPNLAVVVCDALNLKRNLLLFTQIKSLGIPTILAINMADQMDRKGINIDVPALENALDTKIALISARKKQGFNELKQLIADYKNLPVNTSFNIDDIAPEYFNTLKNEFPTQEAYKLWLVISQDIVFGNITKQQISDKNKNLLLEASALKKLQHKETVKRYQFIKEKLDKHYNIDLNKATGFRAKLDNILTHKVWGYVIFFFIMLLIFQAIYDWSSYPMDFIDSSFASLSTWISELLPPGKFTDLLTEGIIPGIGGVVIFIPQIAFLFFFISILEESGYMSRVVFLTDNIMKRFGLSGKSVVPLVSGTACAIPAVMATRNIEDWKERLITILVVPFTTCAARLPVYLIIIALVIPDQRVLGIFNLQGLTLMALYVLGFGMAILSAWLLNKILKSNVKKYFIIEMPAYKLPLARNVFFNVVEKTKAFVFGAGKIILAISIILWVLASYGPTKEFYDAETFVTENYADSLSPEEIDTKIASIKLENSFLGLAGKGIEPIVAPLGYDWKIGIAIVSSFAAREVFVGTLATIYSVNSEEEETIKNRMAAEVNPILGGPLFNFASGISLLLFYAFAMQCMSTLAIVKRETKTWKWPMYQLISMSAIAYIFALAAFQLLK